MKRMQSYSIVRMTTLAVLTAVVLVLQLTGTTIRIPFLSTSVSLVLIPITLGAILLGPLAGAFLGLVFGAVVFVSGGVLGMDPFTLLLFQQHPIITAGICLLKSTLAGFLAGLAYRLLCPRKDVNAEENKNNSFGKISRSLLAVFVAAAVTPIVNTGVFILGCFLIIDSINAYISMVGLDWSPMYFLFIGCAGINFIFEFVVNMIFSPAIERIVRVVGKRMRL